MTRAVIEKRILKLFSVRVYGLDSTAFLDTGAVPNMISTRPLTYPGIESRPP